MNTKSIFLLITLLIACTGQIFAQSVQIKKGDIIEIRVIGHDELSANVLVQQDGTIDYPLISDIPVDGLTLDEFKDVLSMQAAKYTGERPIITVRFSSSIVVNVTVLGQVTQPGEYAVSKSGTIQGAITRAGGITPRAKIDAVKIIRTRDGEKRQLSVNLLQFYETSDPAILPPLEDGDLIIVPGVPGANDVKVIGEVRSPGSFVLYEGVSLIDALYLAGGPTKDAALDHIRIISPYREDTRERVVNYEELLADADLEKVPVIRAGDIIQVPRRNDFWKIFFSTVKDVLAIVLPIAMILRYSKY